MPRKRRHKCPNATYYHLMNRVAGTADYFPFQRRRVAAKFLRLFEFYLQLYCCRLAAFQLMGNHYHAILHFEQFRVLKRSELQKRASMRWGSKWKTNTLHWQLSDWQRFNFNLFDVSKFMQHVNGEFAKWFNKQHKRRGPFWADRFKNPELLDLESVQDCILYVELNAVRAKLTKRPEDWSLGSACWRLANRKNHLLIPIAELFPEEGGRDPFQTYRALLYYRGAVAPQPHKGFIPDYIVSRERLRGFLRSGIFTSRLRLFSDGVAIGSRHELVKTLDRYCEQGLYLRRRHPISHLGGSFFTLREQRSHSFSPS